MINKSGNQQTKTIAFGSCNRQNKDQKHWSVIQSHNPDAFLWLGDAVYSKKKSLVNLRAAYHNLTTNPSYLHFAEHIDVDGIWDDHDYGVNDGGKFVPNKLERRTEYLKFLQSSGATALKLPSEDGLYHSKVLPIGGVKAKIIFLDTRSYRDHHWLRSLGEQTFKGSAVIASFLRAGYSTLGFGRDYGGEMLGAEQWAWVEGELLETRTAGFDINIIVSSIQVLTSNPIFESWGHFPVEKSRLFKLLQKYDPKNLVFLSGDVHLGEVSEADYTRADGSTGKWVEVTSSGLTHSCSDGVTGFLCPIMTTLMHQHRRSAESIYLHRNFGLLQASKLENNPTTTTAMVDRWLLNFTIRAVEDSAVVLSHALVVNKPVATDAAAENANVLVVADGASAIVSVHYADFMQIPAPVTALFVAVFFALFFNSWNWCRKSKCKTSPIKKVA